MLTYDPKQVSQPETQVKGSQEINVDQQINISQMLAYVEEPVENNSQTPIYPTTHSAAYYKPSK
jgi:hypothetical protein